MAGPLYTNLTNQYMSLSTLAQRRAFRQEHPNWWEWYQTQDNPLTSTSDRLAGTGSSTGTSTSWGIPYNPETGNYDPGGDYATGDGSGGGSDDDDEDDEDKDRDGKDNDDEDDDPTGAGPDRDYLRSLLDQFGIATPGNIALIEQAVRNDWSVDRFLVELRKSPDYLANPLFAANIARAKAGLGWMAEGQVLAYGAEIKRLANQLGFRPPSENYIASALQNNLSLAEVEHRYNVSKQIEMYGPAVRAFAETYMGRSLSDEDEWEIFDSEVSTDEFDTAYRRAQYQGRPVLLGFNARSAEEARAYEMMGLSPDEVYQRFENAQGIKSRFERLSLIETDVLGKVSSEGLAAALKGHEDLVVQAGVLMLPDAQRKLQELLSREIGRFNQGSGVARQGTAAVGLLNPSER